MRRLPRTSRAMLHVGNQAGLGHLQAELAAGDAGLQQQRLNVVGQTLARELAGGEIDADPQGAVAGIFAAPGLDLLACLGESPVADGQNQPAFFGQRNEVHGRDESPLGMMPADERLKANDLAGGELDLGLVVEHKLAFVEGAAQVRSARPVRELRLRREACASRFLRTICAVCAIPTGWKPYRPDSQACAVRRSVMAGTRLAPEDGQNSQNLVVERAHGSTRKRSSCRSV